MLSFQDTVGFSVRDTLSIYWFHTTLEAAKYPAEVHEEFIANFPGRTVAYDYVARTAKRLQEQGYLSVHQEQNKRFYQTTDMGRERLAHYQQHYFDRFHEIIQVLDRIYYHLTKNGEKPAPPEHSLPAEFRPYFSKLLSVKDVVRYLALSLSQTRSSFYMAEVGTQLNDLFGWTSSNSYLYKIAKEMEEEELLVGYWPDERRTVRKLKGTEAGAAFSLVIANSLEERVKQVREYLRYMLLFISNENNQF
ncbi:MAG: hypothetical protein ABS939_00625 [Psychrobacillus sp.]